MAAVIIRQKDVDRLAKELLKEIFDFLHDEYILSNFEEMKIAQEVFLRNLVFNHFKTLHRQQKITEEKLDELAEPFRNILFKPFEKIVYDPKFVKDAMEDNGVDTKGIYHTLLKLKLDSEIDGDLYFKTIAFLDIYKVIKVSYSYLVINIMLLLFHLQYTHFGGWLAASWICLR